MATSPEFIQYLEDQFVDFGAVDIRRMFGGSGIYRDGVMFGLVSSDVLYLRTDERNVADFQGRGMKPFIYQHKNNKKPVEMPYSEIPDDVLENPELLADWSRKAFEAALVAKRDKK